MLNQVPRQNTKYKQGLFKPKNIDKLLKANNAGGLYYRSGLELKFMVYLDINENIIRWNTELIKIPYVKNVWDSKLCEMVKSDHSYYPDFYYELKKSDGSISRVVAEVKPESDTIEPKLTSNPTTKQLSNFEYALKMYSANLDKWKTCIEWCRIKGFQFIILTEKHLK
jgi:hypothetical protein